MVIVKSKGPITVLVTVIALNKHSFRANLPRLRQTETGGHKNVPQPLTEGACLGTLSGYLVKSGHARASLCPAESVVGVRVASLPLEGLHATFIRDLLS